jgi:hypothetical protein
VLLPPRSEPGAVAVELIADDIVIRTEDAFLYEARPAPKVTSVTPNNGFTTGGTKVTIEGENFTNDAFVRFGREAVKSIVSRRPDQIVVVTGPSKATGMVDVDVGSADGGTGTMKNAFRYDARPAPTITSVAPPKGAVSGNTEVTIAGKNFIAECVVLVGGKPVTKMKVVDASTIEVKTPPGTGGQMVDVVVRNPDGKEAVMKRAFMYDERYR